jgi:hypothetical protein
MRKEASVRAMRGFPASNSHPARTRSATQSFSSPALRFIIHDEFDNIWGAERVEAGNGGKSPNRPSRVKLLTLIFVFLTLAIIILSAFLYYLPLNDIEVAVDRTYRYTEYGHDYIALKVNLTNKGSISHYVYLTGRVVFNSQPDTVFTETKGWGQIPPGDWHPDLIPIRVQVPNETFQTPYEASCSVTLPPLVNEYSQPWILLPGVVWLVALAAVLTSLVRSWRQTR